MEPGRHARPEGREHDALPQRRAWPFYRREQAGRSGNAARVLRLHGADGRLRQRRLARFLRELRFDGQPVLPQQSQRNFRRDGSVKRLGLQRGWQGAGRHGRDGSRLRSRWQAGYFKTNFSSDSDTLYHNNGDGTFTDATSRAGLAVHTQDVKWGTAFLDFDNDGWADLFVASGHVYPFVDKYGIGEAF